MSSVVLAFRQDIIKAIDKYGWKAFHKECLSTKIASFKARTRDMERLLKSLARTSYQTLLDILLFLRPSSPNLNVVIHHLDRHVIEKTLLSVTNFFDFPNDYKLKYECDLWKELCANDFLHDTDAKFVFEPVNLEEMSHWSERELCDAQEVIHAARLFLSIFTHVCEIKTDLYESLNAMNFVFISFGIYLANLMEDVFSDYKFGTSQMSGLPETALSWEKARVNLVTHLPLIFTRSYATEDMRAMLQPWLKDHEMEQISETGSRLYRFKVILEMVYPPIAEECHLLHDSFMQLTEMLYEEDHPKSAEKASWLAFRLTTSSPEAGHTCVNSVCSAIQKLPKNWDTARRQFTDV